VGVGWGGQNLGTLAPPPPGRGPMGRRAPQPRPGGVQEAGGRAGPGSRGERRAGIWAARDGGLSAGRTLAMQSPGLRPGLGAGGPDHPQLARAAAAPL
jgi:hypothetical protein